MDHVSPDKVIKYVANELSPDEQRAIASHLTACAACRAQIEQQQALYSAMDSWVITPPKIDLTESVLDQLAVTPQAPTRRLLMAPALRIAAAIVLGVGLGHVAGRWVQRPEPVQDTPSPALAATAPDFELLSEPDVIGLWIAYDELTSPDAEDAS